jgi:uncharacterized protein (TIGR02145 family)
MKKILLTPFLLLPFFAGAQTPGGGAADLNGNEYATVIIGDQEWFAENLRTSFYSNGDSIPNVEENTLWAATTEGGWCHFMNDSTYETPYGKLYNWYAAADTRNVCPTGWHVPMQSEWQELHTFLGGANVAGGKMKEAGVNHWDTPNTGGTNASGFTAIGSEERTSWGPFGDLSMGFKAFYWTGEQGTTDPDFGIYTGVYAQFAWADFNEWFKGSGHSMRCVREATTGINELNNAPKKLVRILDLMGRETQFEFNTILIYQYSDGTTKKVVVNL